MNSTAEPLEKIDVSIDELTELFELPSHDPGYKLVAWNDDVTPMDYVVFVFVNALEIPEDKAVDLMWRVHRQGSADLFFGSFDECEQKKELVNVTNALTGHSLRVTVDRAGETK